MVVRLAVVGCGAWGRNHVRAASQLVGAELAAIVEPNPAAQAHARQLAPHAQVHAALDAVLADPTIDALVVASPASTHGALTRAALEARRHVLVEKPFVLDVAEAESLVHAAARAGRTLMVGHLLRYHPAFRALRQRVRAGELGRLHYVHAERVNLGAARDEANVLWALAPHDLSMLFALVDAAPVEVSATGQAFTRPGREDVVFATFRFADDTLGHVHTSWLDVEKRRRLTVVGERRMAVFDDVAPTDKLRLHERPLDATHTRDADPHFPTAAGDVHIPSIRMVEPLVAELQHFVDRVVDGAAPETDGHEALRVLRGLEAASRSLAAGGRPVPLTR
jgi:predicted dehydrogenase